MSDIADSESEYEDGDEINPQDQAMIDLHTEAMIQFDQIQSATQEVRQMCRSDRRFCFIPGAQFEGSLELQFANKPRLEMNKTHLHVNEIINNLKQNQVTVNYKPKDGTENDMTANALDGLYRADEQASNAEEAYANAIEEAVSGGIGAYRFTTEYEDPEDPENDYQRVRIKPIFDADTSVFFDLGAKRADKTDAEYCFIVSSMSPEAFEEEWDVPPTSIDKTDGTTFDWFTPDVVYIAEYYRVEEKKETMHFYEGLAGASEKHWTSEIKDDPELLPRLLATGFREVKTKRVERKQIHKYILSGAEVLEDCGIIAGKYIPVVLVPGERRYIDNVEWFSGAVRYLKDPQRVLNVQVSKLTEYAGYSSRPVPIFSPQQIVGHENDWANQNIEDKAFLLLNQVNDSNGNPMPIGPQAMTQPPSIPPALDGLIQISNQMILDIGGGMAPQSQLPTEISGVALDSIYAKADAQSYGFLHSYAQAVKHGGVIYLSIAKEIYTDKGRKMKTINPQGQSGTVELMQPHADAKGGVANDLTGANFDVVVDVGPASSTKKDATVRQLTHLLGAIQDQATAKVLQGLILYNMDGEGIQDAREYFRRDLVQGGVLKPTEDEAKAMADAQAGAKPNANDQALQAMAEKAQADAMLSKAKVTQVITDNEKSKAQTLEILQGMDLAHLEAVLKAMGTLNPQTAEAPQIIGAPATPQAQPMDNPMPMRMTPGMGGQ